MVTKLTCRALSYCFLSLGFVIGFPRTHTLSLSHQTICDIFGPPICSCLEDDPRVSYYQIYEKESLLQLNKYYYVDIKKLINLFFVFLNQYLLFYLV